MHSKRSQLVARAVAQNVVGNVAPRRYFGKGHKTSEEAGIGRGWYYIPPEDTSLDHLSEEDKVIKAFEATKRLLNVSGTGLDNVLEQAISSPTVDLTVDQSGIKTIDADLDKRFGEFKKDVC